MNLNVNLPPEVQRLLPYIAVAVLAVVGLLLVVRGIGPSEESPPTPPAVEKPAQSQTQTNQTNPGGKSGAKSGAKGGGASSGERAPAQKRTAEAYVNCVQQAADAAALEKCQALVP